MTALNLGRFAGWGMALVPKYPAGFCGGGVPKYRKVKAGFVARLSCLRLPLSMRRAHDEYNWRPEIYIELNGPSTGRGNGATEASRASLSSETPGFAVCGFLRVQITGDRRACSHTMSGNTRPAGREPAPASGFRVCISRLTRGRR